MAFPTDVGSKRDDLERAWEGVRNAAGAIKSAAQAVRTRSAAGPIEAREVVTLADQLANANDRLARYTVVPGLLAYVREQINDPTIDIVAEYNAMLAQINAVRTWVINNFPKDASNYLLYHTFGADGRIVQRTLTSAQTAGLRTQLDALLATLD